MNAKHQEQRRNIRTIANGGEYYVSIFTEISDNAFHAIDISASGLSFFSPIESFQLAIGYSFMPLILYLPPDNAAVKIETAEVIRKWAYEQSNLQAYGLKFLRSQESILDMQMKLFKRIDNPIE